MRQAIVAVCAAVFLAGCVRDVGNSLRVESLEITDGQALHNSGPIRLGDVVDRRPRAEIALIEGKGVLFEGSVPEKLRAEIEAALRSRGVALVVFDAPAIHTEILEWVARAREGFPSAAISAEARLGVSLVDSKGGVRYTATYSGLVEKEHPLAGKEQISGALAEAMGHALGQMLQDARLWR